MVVGNDIYIYIYRYAVTRGIRCIHTIGYHSGSVDPQLPLHSDGSEGSWAFKSSSVSRAVVIVPRYLSE